MEIRKIQRLFRWEVWGLIVASVAAGVSYWAGVHYLPSAFIVVAGFLIMGMFAEMEDELLKKRDISSIGSHDARLVTLHVVRTVVLLAVGVLVFAALGRQF